MDQATKPIALRISPDTERATGLGRSTIYEKIQEGELEKVKIGGRTLILYSSIERMFERARARAEGL